MNLWQIPGDCLPAALGIFDTYSTADSVAIVMLFFSQDLARIADIKYGSLLEVDETLKKYRQAGPKSGDAMLVEQVGPEQIADVVSKWTGKGPGLDGVLQHCGLQCVGSAHDWLPDLCARMKSRCCLKVLAASSWVDGMACCAAGLDWPCHIIGSCILC